MYEIVDAVNPILQMRKQRLTCSRIHTEEAVELDFEPKISPATPGS